MQTIAPRPANEQASARNRDRSVSARHRAPGVGGKAAETLAVLFALLIASALWWLGGFFTLLCLRQLDIPIDQLGLWKWAIPAGISAVELRWWPRARLTEFHFIIFTLVAGVDLLSTAYGVVAWARGRLLPLGSGIMVPSEGVELIIPALVVSLGLTFGPERIALWSLRELRAIWRRDDHA